MRYVGKLKQLNGKRIISFEVDEDVDIRELQRFSTSIISRRSNWMQKRCKYWDCE